MLNNIRRAWVPAGLLLLAGGLAGCEDAGKAQLQEPPPPVVEVSTPVKDMVTDYEEFTGWTAAKDAVDVKARVSGYLSKINFTEGAEVKEGDPIYVLETGKATQEIEAPASGHLVRKAAAGQTYAVGTEIGEIV